MDIQDFSAQKFCLPQNNSNNFTNVLIILMKMKFSRFKTRTGHNELEKKTLTMLIYILIIDLSMI